MQFDPRIIITVSIIIGTLLNTADGCIWGGARWKVYGELKEPDCHDNIDCNHEHEVIEQQLFNNEMMLTGDSAGPGLAKDKRSMDRNGFGEALDQKRAPIYLRESIDPDSIERDKRETEELKIHSDAING